MQLKKQYAAGTFALVTTFLIVLEISDHNQHEKVFLAGIGTFPGGQSTG